MDDAKYSEVTASLIAAGMVIAERLEADPTRENAVLAADMMRKLVDMVAQLHLTAMLARSLIAKQSSSEMKAKIGEVREQSVEAMRESFNAEIKRRAQPDSDVIGAGPKGKPEELVQMPRWEGEKLDQLADLFAVIHAETSDDDPRDIVLRAMATYRHFVTHARAGGQVKFVGLGKERTLTVRLR